MKLEELEKLLGVKFFNTADNFDTFERSIFVVKGKYVMIYENENQIQFFDEKDDSSRTIDPTNSEDLAFLTSAVNKLDEYI